MKIEIKEDPTLTEPELSIRCPCVDAKIQAIIAAAEANDRRMIGFCEGFMRTVDLDDVLYAELVDGKTFLYTSNLVLESRLSLTELETLFEGSEFVRATRQMLINLMHVAGIRPYLNARLELMLDNDEHVIVSRQYAPRIKQHIGL